ncbi:MAG: FecR domain-containing protein [Bacteroidota bacterium]
MSYLDYQAEDFLMDESFRKWLLNADPATSQWWENWLTQYPEKTAVVNQAKQLAQLIHFEHYSLSLYESQQLWQAILANLGSEGNREEGSRERASVIEFPPLRSLRLTYWQKAAVFAGLTLVGMAYFITTLSTTRFQTAYGETRTILLPDSSVVTLQGNSQLKFSTKWNTTAKREVWLKGEAFFSVRKKSINQPTTAQLPHNFSQFIVHTHNLDVNVLGTEFNVNDRRGKTQVVLTSGQIQLAIKSITTKKPLLMQPGEMVEVSDNQVQGISKKQLAPQMQSSWKNNQFVFDNTPLSEVAAMIEDTYGLPVTFKDPSQANRRIRGVIPRGDIEILLAALTNTVNLRFTKDQEKIVIE